jgi:hypothetical protein
MYDNKPAGWWSLAIVLLCLFVPARCGKIEPTTTETGVSSQGVDQGI